MVGEGRGSHRPDKTEQKQKKEEPKKRKGNGRFAGSVFSGQDSGVNVSLSLELFGTGLSWPFPLIASCSSG